MHKLLIIAINKMGQSKIIKIRNRLRKNHFYEKIKELCHQMQG